MSTTSTLHGRHRRVPVEHRTFGIDRRTLPWAVVAAAVWALWVLVGPAVNAAIPWRDETRPGDVLRAAADVTVVPPVGWGLQSGIRTSDRSNVGAAAPPPVILTNGGVQVVLRSTPWTGTATDLQAGATRIDDAQGPGTVDAGAPATFTTDDGVPGVVESASSARTEGLIAAVVLDGTGVEAEVAGPPEQVRDVAGPVRRMLESISGSRS